ncbi:MAG: alkyl sulfatase dimerization domain-containing protein [Halioglobus sp.]|nr:alkyl sulfatase dimerization domain-containing protein [Halioglobus sp.]
MRDPIYKTRPVAPNPARFGGQRINDFVVLSEAFSNAYLIETDEGCVQLNAGMGMEAPVIDANFREFTDQPVHSLIFTQGHVDHVGGTAWFRERNPGLRVIASANNPEHQAYDARLAPFRASRSGFAFTRKFAEAFDYYAQQNYTDFPAQDEPTPDLLVEDKLVFELGGVTFEVIAVPGAETNDSLIVWLPEHRICFTGNLFGCPFGHFPNLVTIRGDRYREAMVVAGAVDTVRSLEPDMICYGHHGPVAGSQLIREELDALYGAIVHVHDATVRGMNEGKDVHTLMREITLPPELEVGQGYGKVSWSVRAIWESYAGWFHHSSTTELYAVPASAVHADILDLAGGVDAVLRRVRDKVAASQPEAALHLLDIVRNAGADNDASRELYIDVHRQLLGETDNFWLSSWLENQISLAGQG